MTQRELERQITREYSKARKEIARTMQKHYSRYIEQDQVKRTQLANGEITRAEYETWLNGQKTLLSRDEELLASVDEELARADETAGKWINGELPYAYMDGRNDTLHDISVGMNGYSYSILDKNAVRYLSQNGDLPITTYQSGTEKHTAYVNKKARQAIQQGVIQGDSVRDVSKRVSKALGDVSEKERKATIRNTRTLMNGAHNAGAYDAMEEATKDGIIIDKQWIATHDERTRAWHADIDGEVRKWNEKFSNGLRFPQDPQGAPEEVYNCRCTYREITRGFYNKYTGKTVMMGSAPQDEYTKQAKQYWDKFNAEKAAEKAKKTKPTSANLNEKGKEVVWQGWESYREQFVGRAVSINDVDISTNFMYDTFDLSKLGAEQEQQIIDTIAQLNNRYYSPLNKVVTMDSQETLHSTAFASTRHDWRTANCEMRINPIKAKDTERLRELSDKGYSIRYQAGHETEYLTTHEYAHSIFNVTEQLPTKATNFAETDFTNVVNARKEVEAVYDRYKLEQLTAEAKYNAIRKPIEEKAIFGTGEVTEADRMALKEARERYEATKISEYANSNVDEFMAECFADAEIGENPSAYSIEVRDIVYKYFGKE